MVKVVGPAFSLGARGKLGDAIFYYDTKWGARVRVPKRTFTPPGEFWNVNKRLFKAASDRAKTLNEEQKAAWEDAYPLTCDKWRDIFMGQQIQAWIRWKGNDLTWPNIQCKSVGDVEMGFSRKVPVETMHSGTGYFDEYNFKKFRKWTCGSLWWAVEGDPTQPTDNDPYAFEKQPYHYFELDRDKEYYLWGGVRYLDGDYDIWYITHP